MLLELDHRGITNTDKIIKKSNNLETLKEYAEQYKNKIDPAKDFQKGTFYFKLIIFKDQDLIVYNYDKQVKDQIEW